MQIENKGTHGIWAVLTAIAGLLATVITYNATETTSVMKKEDVQTIMLQHENENLEEEQVKMREEWEQDSRLEDLEDHKLFVQEMLIDINEKVSP